MVITRLYRQKKNNSGINVEVDGEYLFSLRHQNTILDLNIYVGKNLILDDVPNILVTDFCNKYLEESIIKISRRPHSIFEIEKYLREKLRLFTQKYQNIFTDSNIDLKKIIQDLIEKLITKGYLDDEKFVRSWIEARLASQKYGAEYIKSELLQKRIDKNIIEKYLSDFNSDTDYENAYILAEKKLKLISENILEKKRYKLTNYLLRRGFSSKIIHDIIKNIL